MPPWQSHCIHWFTYLHAALWRILTFACLQNSWNVKRTFLNVFPFPFFSALWRILTFVWLQNSWNMPRKYKDKQHAETQKRLAHKYFWWELLCFYLFSQLKKNYLWWEQTYKRRAIAPAYFACPFAHVTSVKEAASSKSPEESQFF